MEILIYLVGGVALLVGLWRLFFVGPPQPDDPWMLAHRHELTHHFSQAFENTAYDETQQNAAAVKRVQRDAQLSTVRKRHTDPPAAPALVVFRR